MMVCIHVCSGSRGEAHEPTRMRVDKNGVDIFRLPNETNLVLSSSGSFS